MISSDSLHSPDGPVHASVPDQEPIWPTEEQLAYFEQTLPPPSREQLLGTLTKRMLAESSLPAQFEAAESSRDQKIEHYLDVSSVVSFQWLEPSARKNAEYGFGFVLDPDFKDLDGHTKQQLREDTPQSPVLERLIKKGIYETCTLQRLDDLEYPSHAGEKVYGVAYEASGHGYEDASGRDCCAMWTKFVLPESLAKQLWRDAWEDPTILRDMSERHIKKNVLSEEGRAEGGAWDTYGRPPYDKWDSRPENTMAFRFKFDETPSDIPPERIIPISSKTS